MLLILSLLLLPSIWEERIERQVLSSYLRNQHPITGSNTHGQPLSILAEEAGTDGEDLGLVELLDARLGEEDARGGLGLGLDALDEDAVEEGNEGANGADGGGLDCDIR